MTTITGLTYTERAKLVGRRDLTPEQCRQVVADATYATKADAIAHEVVPMLAQYGSDADPADVSKIVGLYVDWKPGQPLGGRIGWHVDIRATAEAAGIR